MIQSTFKSRFWRIASKGHTQAGIKHFDEQSMTEDRYEQIHLWVNYRLFGAGSLTREELADLQAKGRIPEAVIHPLTLREFSNPSF